MSTKYTGGFITKSPVAPTTTAASGVWTLDQQQQAQKAGTWPSPPIFIEDLFSTWLYTGNGSTQTITNGIDLAGEGGLVWAKPRSVVGNNTLYDTSRGISNALISNSTASQQDYSGNGVTSFNSNGFAVTDSGPYAINDTGTTYAAWTFREQPKFFDVVTYTGNNATGSGVQNIAHNLGATPGCIIIKCFDVDGYDWVVYHRSLGASQYVALNTTGAASATSTFFNATAPTSTQFTVGTSGFTNGQGQNYVAYIFAHNAGGFPASGAGSTNGISCGSYTGNGSATGPAVNLGYEPQWVMIKKSSAEESWYIYDNMRGVVTGAVTAADRKLRANSGGAEGGLTANDPINFGATGFNIGTTDNELNDSGGTYIYVAIRRGPMKPPTTGTSVFAPVAYAGNSSASTTTTNTLTNGFATDMALIKHRNDSGGPNWGLTDKLRGPSVYLETNVTASESTQTSSQNILFNNTQTRLTGFQSGDFSFNFSSVNYIQYAFQRAPGFFDEVCYTGNGSGSGQVITHNLGVTPELIIIKSRSGAFQWHVYAAPLGQSKALFLEETSAEQANTAFTGGTINSTQFQLTVDFSNVNGSGVTYVSYLFASAPGVSKVGSFTGTGATQVINCGFTAGARFVLIKATSTTGNWLVWDSARGIVAGDDPYLRINSAAVEVTNTDWVDTAATGFELSNAGGNLANSSGVSYIFLAIA
jgi:hypothetical protein